MQFEIRDTTQARIILSQGLCLTCIAIPEPRLATLILKRLQEVMAIDELIFPPGVAGDLGLMILGSSVPDMLDASPPGSVDKLLARTIGADSDEAVERENSPPIPAYASATTEVRGPQTGGNSVRGYLGKHEALFRRYEDHVLGKWHYDTTLERAGDALLHYPADQMGRGLAFALHQARVRIGFGGLRISPAIIKSAMIMNPQKFFDLGLESLITDGLAEEYVALYEHLIEVMKHAPRLLGSEDIFELEHKTALAEYSQRLALRQVLKTADHYQTGVQTMRWKPITRRPLVATRLREEDAYPVGGFSSISYRGSVESLLHSELAYMERDERPDLFDIKFARNELLYYSRDENQFFRRHCAYLFCFHPELYRTRFKDPGSPYQRIIHILALIVAAVRRLIDVLTNDSLVFHMVFITAKPNSNTAADTAANLAGEQHLLEMVLREQIANGTVVITQCSLDERRSLLTDLTRRSFCHVLEIDVADHPPQPPDPPYWIERLVVSQPHPQIGWEYQPLQFPEDSHSPDGGEPLVADPSLPDSEVWVAALRKLLACWI